MKQLVSLNGDGNKVRFIRGNDGDICITFDIPEKKIYSECVRVGSCHSGGQYVPPYVKQALHRIVDALDRWDKEQDAPYKLSHELESNTFDVSERILQYGEGALFAIVHETPEDKSSPLVLTYMGRAATE